DWITRHLPEIGEFANAGQLLTDTANTKHRLEQAAAVALGAQWRLRWLGGHPILSPFRSVHPSDAGIAGADAALFEGALWCVVPPSAGDGALPRPTAEI